MSSNDMSCNTVYTNTVLDERPTGFLERMCQTNTNTNTVDDIGNRTVTIDATNNVRITIPVGGTVMKPEPSIDGSKLLSRLSELSLRIQHDNEYDGDYIQLYNLMTSIVTDM